MSFSSSASSSSSSASSAPATAAGASNSADFAKTSVSQLVLANVLRAPVMQRYQLDYCCHGRQSLADAVRERPGLSLEEVCQQLAAADREAAAQSQQSAQATDLSHLRDVTMATLMQHIVETHHKYVRAELARLAPLVAKIVRVHGERDARLARLQSTFTRLQDALIAHVDDEENTFFPAIRLLEAEAAAAKQQQQQSKKPDRVAELARAADVVREHVLQLEHEHEDAAVLLTELRALTDTYTPPAYACATVHTVFAGLRRFDDDLRLHVAKENGLLHVEARELLTLQTQPQQQQQQQPARM